MSEHSQWTILSNHGHVMVYVAQHPDRPLRQVALDIGITERAVQRIVADLESAGFLERQREGRRNRYTIHREAPLRHPLEAHCQIGELINCLEPASAGS